MERIPDGTGRTPGGGPPPRPERPKTNRSKIDPSAPHTLPGVLLQIAKSCYQGGGAGGYPHLVKLYNSTLGPITAPLWPFANHVGARAVVPPPETLVQSHACGPN
jgi:hypothetical protein